MPRNAAGNYTLPLPPVVQGTTIVASFENTTDSDIATELTNSLDRNGRGGMLAPFKIADGTVSAPGIAFTNDPDNGFYRVGPDDWAATVGGATVLEFTANTVTITGGLRTTDRVLTGLGSAAAPAHSFIGDPATGFYLPAGGILDISCGGVFSYRFQAGALSMGTNFLNWNDVALARSSAGTLEVNSTVAGTFRDLKLRDAYAARYVFNADSGCHVAGPAAGIVDITVGSQIYRSSVAAFQPIAGDASSLGAAGGYRWTTVHTISVLGALGSQAAPTYAIGGANTGLYGAALGLVDITLSGIPIYRFSPNSYFPYTDNSVSLGVAPSFRWSVVYAATGTISTSDARLKKDVKDSRLGLDFINALHPVSYRWITGSNKVVQEGEGEDSKTTTVALPGVRTHWGLIAQDVAKAVDASGVEDFAGYVVDDRTNPDSYLSLRYEEFIGPLIKAVQELSARVLALEVAP